MTCAPQGALLFLCNNNPMLFVIDIGNTNTNIGVFEGENLLINWNVASDLKRTGDEYGILLLNLLNSPVLKKHPKAAIISTVVPPLGETFKTALKKYLDIEARLISHKSKLPFKITIKTPSELGADRIANAAAAVKLYKLPAIVIDFGTATTFDIVDENKNFVGGIITPGLKIQANSLSSFTSKLPKVKIEAPKTAIGKDTISAMLSGIVRGHACMIDGMIKLCEEELGKKASIIATGGFSSVLFPNMERPFDYINKDLTLEGLRYLYELNKG